MIIVMPWPPSVNRYWRSIGRGRVIISKQGRDYRKAIADLIHKMNLKTTGEKLTVLIEAYPPDWRLRDLDNIKKALLDSLQKAGVYNDDFQIDCDLTTRMPPFSDGRVVIGLYTDSNIQSITHIRPEKPKLKKGEKIKYAADTLTTFSVELKEAA